MRLLIVLVAALCVARPVVTSAQAGRLPLLANMPAQAVCGTVPLPSTLPSGEVARILKLDSDSLQRAVRLAVDAAGRSLMLTDRVFGRSNEYEQVSALFDANGRVRGGFREYSPPKEQSAGTKAQQNALQPGDTSKVQALAAAVLKKCSR